MPRPDQFFEWQNLVEHETATSVGSRERLRLLFGLFIVAALAIVVRAAQLEWTHGAGYRAAASRPGRQVDWLPAERGRILARDGSVLAEDAAVVDLDVDYRALQEPPDRAWLRRLARARLPAMERGKADRVAAAEAAICQERRAWRRRLAAACGLSDDEWDSRCARIQARVERIAERVNAVRSEPGQGAVAESPTDDEPPSILRLALDLFAINDATASRRTIVAEERAYHTVVAGLPPHVVAAIKANPDDLSGAKLVERLRRHYPAGRLAANIVGRIGRDDSAQAARLSTAGLNAAAVPPPTDVGLMGVERVGEATLRGEWGQRVHATNQRRQRTAVAAAHPPVRGADVRLTLDPRLQLVAETLLDRALANPAPSADRPAPKGGAIVVMHVETGELLAAATAPRFDPNIFANRDDAAIAAVLAGPGQPLFDRATKMALPPGSVFKVITALAALEAGAITPDAVAVCQGYLRESDHLRCATFRHSGVGHGQLRLRDALARSCNVFFFQLAEQLGPGPLVTWGERFGAGARTGLDLGEEGLGQLATPGSMQRLAQRPWQNSDTHHLAVGQGPITATPLQVARWLAAIANGGDLVAPRVFLDDGPLSTTRGHDLQRSAEKATRHVSFRPASLAAIREGLERTITDPEGTAHASLALCWPPVAGKTGTAEVGGGRPDHAWFAGYTPVERPEWAIVVALEEGGNGSTAAAPLARRIGQALGEAGHIHDREQTIR